MSEINTNAHPDSIITEIKAQNYTQNTAGNLTQDSQAELALVKNDFYKTGKDTYNLTVHGKTELNYGYRSRTSNGNVEENAEGNKIEKCMLSAMRLHLGARNSIKIGPAFFTTSLSNTRLDIGIHLSVTTLGLGTGLLRGLSAYGAYATITGVQTVFGMNTVEHAMIDTAQVTAIKGNYEDIYERQELVDQNAEVTAQLIANGELTVNNPLSLTWALYKVALHKMRELTAAERDYICNMEQFQHIPDKKEVHIGNVQKYYKKDAPDPRALEIVAENKRKKAETDAAKGIIESASGYAAI
jgi:hypothetical protein